MFVITGFLVMRHKEVKGHWPFMKLKPTPSVDAGQEESASDGPASKSGVMTAEQEKGLRV